MEATAGYREPSRTAAESERWQAIEVPMPAVRSEITATVWSPPGAGDRVLIAHDGPDFQEHGRLGGLLEASIAGGQIRPCHLVLLPAADRLEWYSASPAYARSLALDVVPRVTSFVGAAGPVVGAGVSLGALAMLHAQRRHAALFAGLFLQSGSFFQPRYDSQENGFARWLRIVRFVGRLRRAGRGPAVPTTMTCGLDEENLANNRDMAAALTAQGYPLRFAEIPGGHTWESWRPALGPHLIPLLQRVWS